MTGAYGSGIKKNPAFSWLLFYPPGFGYDQSNLSPLHSGFLLQNRDMFAYPPGTLVNAGATLSLLRLMVLHKYWDILKFLQKQISQDMNALHTLEQYVKLWYSIIIWSRWGVISFMLSSMTSILNDSISEAESVCVHSVIIMNG